MSKLARLLGLVCLVAVVGAGCSDARAPRGGGSGGSGGSGGDAGGGGQGGAGVPEDCGNGLDDDGDGQVDCLDDGCAALPACAGSCGDGSRNPGEDCDGADLGGRTCADLGLQPGLLGCSAACGFDASRCGAVEACDGGEDEDGDGDVDCDDADCSADPACGPEPERRCADGLDDDGDGAADCADPDCEFRPACSEDCVDGLDNDGDGASDCADPACVVDAACGGGGEICDNFFDDDGDGAFDCDDPTSCSFSGFCTPGSGAVGEPCSANLDCAAQGNDPICFTELATSYPRGACSEWCQVAVGDCPGGTVCLGLPGDGAGYCMPLCAADSDCREGFSCVDSGDGLFVCAGNCTDDSQCTAPGYCDNDGRCLQPEDCTNGVDDDHDGIDDCEDSECFADPGCPNPGLCAGAPAAGSSESGDTGNGSNAFRGGCSPIPAHEVIYTVTPGAPGETGTLTLRLQSPLNLVLYVRTDCVDGATELGCANDQFSGDDEVLQLVVDGGVTYTVFVDSFMPGDESPFTLLWDFVADSCGDGMITGAEQCEPPGVGDCTASCALMELACWNFADDDLDRSADCDDPECATAAECVPGSGSLGTACVLPSDCAAPGGRPACLDEVVVGWPRGSCSEWCTVGSNDCGPTAVCQEFGLGFGGLCLVTCASGADCRQGYDCQDVGAGPVCVPLCTSDADCPTAGLCDPGYGVCFLPEACGNGLDDDRDGSTDCADFDCFGDPACAEVCSNGLDDDFDSHTDCDDDDCATEPDCPFGDACAATTPASASNPGDTSGGSSIFSGSCTGSGARERLFSYTPGSPGQTGTLTITLRSATDQGLYVRTFCTDPASELGCADSMFAGTDEVLVLPVTGGVPLIVVVDGFAIGEEGPFELLFDFVADP